MKTVAPSDVKETGIPNIEINCRITEIKLEDVSEPSLNNVIQLEYRQTTTKYVCLGPSWKKSAHIASKGYVGSSGSCGGMAGLLGANLEHC